MTAGYYCRRPVINTRKMPRYFEEFSLNVALLPALAFCFGFVLLLRSVGSHGEELTDEELEWAVLCLEEAEARMTTMEFSVAAGILERVVER